MQAGTLWGGGDAVSYQPSALLVDDDAAQRMFLSFDLEGFTLVEATTAVEAFDLAVEQRPDVLIVDRRLPDGDGLELVRRFRRRPSLARLPIVMVTAGFDEADRVVALKAGVDEYLPKPLDVGDLGRRLERLLELPEEERRPRRVRFAAQARLGRVGDPDPTDVIDLRTPPEPTESRRRFRLRRSA